MVQSSTLMILEPDCNMGTKHLSHEVSNYFFSLNISECLRVLYERVLLLVLRDIVTAKLFRSLIHQW